MSLVRAWRNLAFRWNILLKEARLLSRTTFGMFIVPISLIVGIDFGFVIYILLSSKNYRLYFHSFFVYKFTIISTIVIDGKSQEKRVKRVQRFSTCILIKIQNLRSKSAQFDSISARICITSIICIIIYASFVPLLFLCLVLFDVYTIHMHKIYSVFFLFVYPIE